MSDTTFECSVNPEAEWINSINNEALVGADDHNVLIVIERYVSYVLSLLELVAKRGEVCR